MADTQSTQTRPKYHFRFLALDRANRKAAPCCISVDASSECEARRVLAPYFILSLAARLPVYGESHQTASTVTEIEMVGGMVKMPTPSAIEKISTPSVCISEIETEVRNA
ncbi:MULTISPECIES: host cell division inhibitor Icd-like protein [Serratia]|uniref:host cell division inhibitor Icd-like protein n=1 Tax=Serratia TaxID=613 RepID=UPI001EF65C22|nr:MULTISPECIES: host cell division inhibitor Icd-like protein [Serratia]UTN95873.1 host cell division inhibitor Icd-like protein [Serratia plymuthica]